MGGNSFALPCVPNLLGSFLSILRNKKDIKCRVTCG